PYFPLGLPGVPQLIEFQVVLVRVHALPEAGMLICDQLPFVRQLSERLAFEHAIVVQVIEDLSIEDEETAIDPILDDRLLLELRHGASVVKFQQTEIRARVDGGGGADPPGRREEFEEAG